MFIDLSGGRGEGGEDKVQGVTALSNKINEYLHTWRLLFGIVGTGS